jgi:hypothetical protein
MKAQFNTTVKGSGLVDNNNEGLGEKCLVVYLWGYATYLTVHSTLAHLGGGGVHPTTLL